VSTLEQIQEAERQQLERLVASLENRAHDLSSLTEVLAACQTFTAIDPVSHIKKALRNYLAVSDSQDVCGNNGAVEQWEIEVKLGGEKVLSVSPDHVSGACDPQDCTEEITECARNILSFIGCEA
jgi:hypothetical protein